MSAYKELCKRADESARGLDKLSYVIEREENIKIQVNTGGHSHLLLSKYVTEKVKEVLAQAEVIQREELQAIQKKLEAADELLSEAYNKYINNP